MWLVKKLNREIRNLRKRDAISSVEERNWIRENWGFEEDKIARALQVAPFLYFYLILILNRWIHSGKYTPLQINTTSGIIIDLHSP